MARPVGGVLAAGALVALLVGSADGVRTTRGLSSPLQVAAAKADDARDACLTREARQVVTQGALVSVAGQDLADQVALIQAVGGWAVVDDQARAPGLYLSLRPAAPGAPSCRGMTVAARWRRQAP